MRPIDADAFREHILGGKPIGLTICQYSESDILGMIREQPTITSLPNDPLTLDELREMDGEPVWCIIIDGDYKGESFWGLVSIDTAECICSNWDVIIFAYYGKTWLAYRRRPEGNKDD